MLKYGKYWYMASAVIWSVAAGVVLHQIWRGETALPFGLFTVFGVAFSCYNIHRYKEF